MNSQNQDRNTGRGSGGRRRRRRKPRAHSMPPDLAQCAICRQNIRDALTAIVMSEDGAAAHFDCVVKKLSDEEELRSREKICYLGGGEFGIVRFNSADSKKFTIRKRIRLESAEYDPEWRKSISNGLST